MNFTTVINGSHGFEAAGFAKSVLLNQLGFDLQIGLFQVLNNDEQPVFDARLKSALGDTGIATKKKLDTDSLLSGYAAAFLLLNRHIHTANPENGRKPEHLIKYLKQPDTIINDGVNYRMERQKQQIAATAAMLKCDPKVRLEAVTKEQKVQADAMMKPVMDTFIENVAKYRDLSTSELIDIAVDSLTSAGRNVALELKRAANALLDAQKKRFAQGGFVAVDAGIYAIAQANVGEGVPTSDTSGEDIAAAAAAAAKTVADAKEAKKRRAAAKRAARK